MAAKEQTLSDYCTAQEASIQLGFTVVRVYELIAEGKLDAIRLTGRRLILVPRSEVARLRKQREAAGLLTALAAG